MAIAEPKIGMRVDRSLDATEICRQLAEGQCLLEAEEPGATVVLWSAFEAAVRLSLTELGQETDDPISISDTPLGLATQAVAYGVIDPDDRDVLHRFLAFQEAAHDGTHPIDIALCQKVSWFTERTLDEMEIHSMVNGPVIYPPHPITFDEYMAEDRVKLRYDIVNGVRVFAVPPSIRHQDILGNFLSLSYDYGDQHGYITLYSLFDVQISREPFCTRQPDVMLVSETRMKGHRDGEPLSVAPELVIEIISSIDRELALDNKLRDYAAIGVQECWVVSPERQIVEVARLSSDGVEIMQTYSAGQTVCSLVCHDLSVQINDILLVS